MTPSQATNANTESTVVIIFSLPPSDTLTLVQYMKILYLHFITLHLVKYQIYFDNAKVDILLPNIL